MVEIVWLDQFARGASLPCASAGGLLGGGAGRPRLPPRVDQSGRGARVAVSVVLPLDLEADQAVSDA